MGNGERNRGEEHAKRDELADALSRIEHDLPSEAEPAPPLSPERQHASPPSLPPPASAAQFRRPARPSA
ncbi:MAG TPA: hypothetical protein VGR35_01400, partial [Tepidisphaeraceae bacterium]|nr:hypothetical protein [Tepidisphaeraceae bacterium]